MIRYGIVGFGLHATRRLAPGFAASKDSVAVALQRRDQQKAREDAKQFNIPHYFATTEELARCPEVDVVLVTTPNSLHHSDVLTAVRAGKHVLCEKPMAMSAAEAEEMLYEANKAGVLLGIAQCFRFGAGVTRFRERVQNGEIGKPLSARSDFSFLATGSKRTWLTDAVLAGGGPIADIGVHCIDALRYVLQDDPLRVSAFTQSDDDAGTVECSAALNLHFRQGTFGAVTVSYRAPYNTALEVMGTDGVLRADHGLTVDHPITIDLIREGKIVDREPISNATAYEDQVDAFSAWVRGKAEFRASGADGVKNQMTLDAAYRSAKSAKIEETGV
jgi:predicted dehydrogenase